jgi:hypothetical protein
MDWLLTKRRDRTATRKTVSIKPSVKTQDRTRHPLTHGRQTDRDDHLLLRPDSFLIDRHCDAILVGDSLETSCSASTQPCRLRSI